MPGAPTSSGTCRTVSPRSPSTVQRSATPTTSRCSIRCGSSCSGPRTTRMWASLSSPGQGTGPSVLAATSKWKTIQTAAGPACWDRRRWHSRSRSGIPVIAKVRGWCIGGGNEINVICDLSIAAESAKFGQAGPKMGSVPIWWGTQLLPRLVGDKRAKEIIMLCEPYTATEAQRMGWINKVVPDDELDAATRAWCDRLLSLSPQALRVAKHMLNMEADRQWPSVPVGFQYISFIHDTKEFHEGTSAFLEKRPADFGPYR